MDNIDHLVRSASLKLGTAVGPCLSEDELAPFYAGQATADRALVIQEHLSSCSPCLEIARDYCVFMGVTPPADVIQTPRRNWAASPLFRIAATVLFAAGIGAAWFAMRPVQQSTTARSTQSQASIEIVSPKGAQTHAPAYVEWKILDGADSYEVELRDVRLNVLWRQLHISGSNIELPADVVQKLATANEYAWRVTAITTEGRRVNSAFTTFSIAP